MIIDDIAQMSKMRRSSVYAEILTSFFLLCLYNYPGQTIILLDGIVYEYLNDIMSIIRGVNRRNSVEQPQKQADCLPHKSARPFHTPSQGQWQQMLQEMKSLMKENTRLKHENLQLKEKLMLAKIELENTRLHNQQQILKLQEKIPERTFRKKSEGKTTQASHRVLKIDESTHNLLKFQSQDFTVASSLKGKENEFWQWPSKQSLDAPESISFREKEQNTPKCQIFNPDELRKKSTTVSTKMSKKDQILNKYRKFLEHSGQQSEITVNISRHH